MPLEKAYVGARHIGLKITFLRNDGSPLDLSSASMSARIQNLAPGGSTVASDGIYTVLAGASLSISAAANSIPIALTIANHGLVNGTTVKVAGGLGLTNMNGLWFINVLDINTIQLNGSVGNGTYTGGGVLTPNVSQFQWAYGAADLAAAGNFEIQFKALYGDGSFELSQVETWQVAPAI